MPKIGNTNNNYDTLINRFLNCLKQLKSQIWIQIELIFFPFFSFFLSARFFESSFAYVDLPWRLFLFLSLTHSCSLWLSVCRSLFAVFFFLFLSVPLMQKQRFFFYSKNMYQTNQKQKRNSFSLFACRNV